MEHYSNRDTPDGCQLRRDAVVAVADAGFDVGGVADRSWAGAGLGWGASLCLARVGVGEAVLRGA